MIIDVTQVTRVGRVYRKGSPPLNVEQIKCFEGTKKNISQPYFLVLFIIWELI